MVRTHRRLATRRRVTDPASRAMRIALPKGHLRIEVREAVEPLDRLCGFGARAGNPHRPFLVVSRVLGKHVPVSPSRVATIHDALARLIPTDLPGPVLCIGLAETATGLGRGVFDRWVRRSGRTDATFVASTRRPDPTMSTFTFEEPHSHAARHWITEPRGPLTYAEIRSAVLVDDEVTTGTTLENLSSALHRRAPRLAAVHRVAITDWSNVGTGGSSALLRGVLQYDSQEIDAPQTAPASLEPSDAAAPSQIAAEIPDGIRHRCAQLGVRPGDRILVLGVGEYLHQPYLAATALADIGAQVQFQSTTRSPASIWGDIRSALSFSDPSEHGETRFLYNATRSQYDRVLLCAPGSSSTVPAPLVQALGAESLNLDRQRGP